MRARKYTIISLIFWLIFISFGIYNFRKGGNNHRAVQQSELTLIEGKLENQPSIQTSKSGSSVDIKLKEYPSFIFQVAGVNYHALRKDFTSEVLTGDTIFLNILTNEYETKILKTKKLSFSEKIINYKFIEPFAIHSKNKAYMELENTNTQIEDNRALGFWFFSIAAFLYFLYSILYWTGSIRKFATWWIRTQASR